MRAILEIEMGFTTFVALLCRARLCNEHQKAGDSVEATKLLQLAEKLPLGGNNGGPLGSPSFFLKLEMSHQSRPSKALGCKRVFYSDGLE